jgi:predicted amidophosphoribosyltransferase
MLELLEAYWWLITGAVAAVLYAVIVYRRRACANCGAHVPPATDTCPSCGQPFRWGPPYRLTAQQARLVNRMLIPLLVLAALYVAWLYFRVA